MNFASKLSFLWLVHPLCSLGYRFVPSTGCPSTLPPSPLGREGDFCNANAPNTSLRLGLCPKSSPGFCPRPPREGESSPCLPPLDLGILSVFPYCSEIVLSLAGRPDPRHGCDILSPPCRSRGRPWLRMDGFFKIIKIRLRLERDVLPRLVLLRLGRAII